MKTKKNIEAKASQANNQAAVNAEVLNPEVAQAIAIENATEVEPKATLSKKEKKAAKKAAKAAAAKEAQAVPTAQEEAPKTEGKVKKDKEKKASKEEAATVKEVAKQQKAALIEKVVANREVKYIYPEDVTDTLSRKTWRQKTRNKLHQLELAVSRIKDQNSKEYKKALKEYEDFKKEVLKPEQVA
ncbi:MAG: hypothetical protein NC131_06080 [Roseburia sp.]|nr:hypothetical protein [Roseburia sp.]